MYVPLLIIPGGLELRNEMDSFQPHAHTFMVSRDMQNHANLDQRLGGRFGGFYLFFLFFSPSVAFSFAGSDMIPKHNPQFVLLG